MLKDQREFNYISSHPVMSSAKRSPFEKKVELQTMRVQLQFSYVTNHLITVLM